MSATPPKSLHNRQLLSTTEASERSGLSRSYIKHLAQTGRIAGIKPGGHDWLIDEGSLLTFLAQPRSKGREGPRKQRIVRQTEQGERVLLSTAEARELSGYRQDSLLRLLRQDAIEGERSGRTWLIYEDSLLAYKRRKHPTIVESTLVKPQASSESSPSLEPPSELESPEPSPDE